MKTPGGSALFFHKNVILPMRRDHWFLDAKQQKWSQAENFHFPTSDESWRAPSRLATDWLTGCLAAWLTDWLTHLLKTGLKLRLWQKCWGLHRPAICLPHLETIGFKGMLQKGPICLPRKRGWGSWAGTAGSKRLAPKGDICLPHNTRLKTHQQLFSASWKNGRRMPLKKMVKNESS